LRLGQEVSGWEHALQAHQQDGYDTTTFNLLELKDQLAQFKTLEDEFFIIRMDSREADVYGQQVIKLLHNARSTLCEKYQLDLKDKITVEIFPDPDDFAVRTFGMPAVSGYLGVCFGKVITANSPASQAAHPTNWQSVLWHEFCHVVTLELTKNKMPRWISEGISVYEERQKNPCWGETMIPQYREIILKGESTPIGELSSAFLNPKSSLHIQFAYYQSSMVVEYLIDQFGFEALQHILHDLRVGIPINVAIERRTKILGELEQDFEAFLKDQTEKFAPGVDWSEQNLAALMNDDTERFADWVQEHPRHFQGLMAYAQILEEEKPAERTGKYADQIDQSVSPNTREQTMPACNWQNSIGSRDALIRNRNTWNDTHSIIPMHWMSFNGSQNSIKKQKTGTPFTRPHKMRMPLTHSIRNPTGTS